MLLSHLDTTDHRLKNNYNKAMAALDRYYNNRSKIKAACIKEIRVLPNIIAGDYEALVSFKMCIINNHTRLSAVGLEHEVSNADRMQQLVSKLPSPQVEKWSEFFEE